MSGNAITDFWSPSPAYAKIISHIFLSGVGINPFQSPKVIYQELIKIPIERILEGAKSVAKSLGSRLTFVPVIETLRSGPIPVLPKSPEELMDNGYGKDYPLLISFTNGECQNFKKIMLKALQLLIQFPSLVIPINLFLQSSPFMHSALVARIASEYFNNEPPTVDRIADFCTEVYYKLPSFKITENRLKLGGAPTYIYEFEYGYRDRDNWLKAMLKLNWTGVGHTEDFSYIFRINSLLGPPEPDELTQSQSDNRMLDFMTTLLSNFVKTGYVF